jgi:hypothetical protein
VADRAITQELTSKIIANITAFGSQRDTSYYPIVNERHFDRLASLCGTTSGTVAHGGGFDRSTLGKHRGRAVRIRLERTEQPHSVITGFQDFASTAGPAAVASCPAGMAGY